MANSRLKNEREAGQKEAVELADQLNNELDELQSRYDKAITEGREAATRFAGELGALKAQHELLIKQLKSQ